MGKRDTDKNINDLFVFLDERLEADRNRRARTPVMIRERPMKRVTKPKPAKTPQVTRYFMLLSVGDSKEEVKASRNRSESITYRVSDQQ